MATRKIETEIALSGEKEFNDAMKALNNNMKNLRAEMKAVTTSFDENSSAADKLKARQDLLTQQIEQQEEIVRALGEMYEKQAKEQGENSAAADKYRQAMLNAQSTLNGYKRDLAAVTEELKDAEKATDKAGDEAKESAPKYRSSAEAMEKAESSGRKLGKALGTVASASLKAAGGMAKLGAKGVAYSIAGLGIAATGASVGLVALGTKGFGALVKASVSASENAWGFWRLRNALGGLEDASQDAQIALGRILAPALTSFAKSSTEMLEDFSKEMKKAEGDTEAMGGIMAKYVKKSAELIRDEAPAFVSAAGGLIKGLTKGIIENEDEITAAAQETIELFSDFLGENADDIGRASAVIIKSLGSMVTENAPALMSAGASMITSIVSGIDPAKVGETVIGMIGALNTAVSDSGEDLIGVGFAILGEIISGLDDNADDISGTVLTLAGALGDGVVEHGDDLLAVGLKFLTQMLSGIDADAEAIGGAIVSLIGGIGTAIFTYGDDILALGVSILGGILTGIIEGLTGEDVTSPGSAVDALLTSMSEAIVAATSKILQMGADILAKIWEGMKAAMPSIKEWLANELSWSNIGGYGEMTYGGATGAGVGIAGIDWGRHATGLDTVPYDNYPAFLHADEMVLKAPLARELRGLGISNASGSVYGALSRGVPASAGPAVVENKLTIEFGGSLAQLGRVLQPYIKAEEQRRGASLVT